MRKLTIMSIAILMIIAGCTIIAHGQDINTETYNIELTTNDDSISVVEKITIDTDSGDIILIWIQSEHRDISFIINDSVITTSPSISETDIFLISPKDGNLTGSVKPMLCFCL